MNASRYSSRSALSSVLSNAVYDIPAWARTLIVLAGLAGLVIVVVASLVGRTEQTIPVDKLLHFGGYATLATIFVLGLKTSLYLPVLALLALISIGIEYLQPFNARTFDVSDMVANIIGIVAGAVLGLVLRSATRVVGSQVKQAKLRKQRRSYSAGSILLREGSPVSKFLVIEKGQVQLSKEVDGRKQVLGTLGAGEIIGLLGVIQSQPQFTTVEAVQQTTAYSLDMNDIMDTSDSTSDPVHLVLNALCRQVRVLAEHAVSSEKPLS